jgi:hypothetical protein
VSSRTARATQRNPVWKNRKKKKKKKDNRKVTNREVNTGSNSGLSFSYIFETESKEF